MATITETYDGTINAHAHGNYDVREGDIFNGTLNVGDTEDGVNFRDLVPGTTYTVSLTVDDLAGFSAVTIINHNDFHSITHHVSDGVPHWDHGWDRSFVSASPVRVDLETNTISFDFTPAPGFTSFAVQVQGSNVFESYSLSFEEAVLENIVDGSNGNDKLKGTEGVDVLNGGEGKDQLTSGEGNDTLNGENGNDLLRAGEGDDVLNGGANNDRLYGHAGEDSLNGGSGNDKLFGGDDNDVLDGGTGKDTLTGGAGEDVFVFSNESHRDTITDFENGIDQLDFSGFAGINSIADLSIAQSGSSVVIRTGGPAQVTLRDTDVLDIDVSDFIF